MIVMLPAKRVIQPLPVDVVAQIKSSNFIPSLSIAVLGLLDNALDAGARNIDISVDFLRGACCVEDDGCGIPPIEFEEAGGLGKLYRTFLDQHNLLSHANFYILSDTSKFGSEARFHGANGVFLSSLAALSVLYITSHHYEQPSHNTLILHHSRPAARLLPSPSHHHLTYRDHGTRITVQDLFGNMPVRVKQRGIEHAISTIRAKDWESLCRNITGTLLAWDTPVALTIRGAEKNQLLQFRAPNPVKKNTGDGSVFEKSKAFDPSLLRSVLVQGARLSMSTWRLWDKASALTAFMAIRAIFSLQPAPSKQAQFISIGTKLINHDGIGSNVLYDEVNRLFTSSDFGTQEEIILADGTQLVSEARDRRNKISDITNKQLKGNARGIDRWPMFYIRIELFKEVTSRGLRDDCHVGEGNTLTAVMNVLGAMVHSFLTEHNLRPRSRRVRSTAQGTKIESSKQKDRSSLDLASKKGCDFHYSTLQRSYLHFSNDASVTALSSGHFQGGDLELGFNVKLPSFAQGVTSGLLADLRGSSRMKSGSRGSASNNSDRHSTYDGSIQERLLIRASPGALFGPSRYEDTPISSSLSRSCLCEPKLASDDGTTEEVSRQFHEQRHTYNNSISNGDLSTSGYDQLEICDATVTWINPITKAVILINSRTGIEVKDPRPTTSSSNPTVQNSERNLERPLSSKSDSLRRVGKLAHPPLIPKAGTWANDFLKSWENLIFQGAEENIQQISTGGPLPELFNNLFGKSRWHPDSIENAFKESSTYFSAKLLRESLKDAVIISQVDRKFILLIMAKEQPNSLLHAHSEISGGVLVIVDQHAADERIRIEALYAELFTAPSEQALKFQSSLGLSSAIETTCLTEPITFRVKSQERILFRRHSAFFARWGILFDLSQPQLGPSVVESTDLCQISIRTLPPGIAERCRVDVKCLIELMRREIWKKEEGENGFSGNLSADSFEHESDWLRRIRDCPQGILDLLNSRSCRSAIMFNDFLTLEECRALILRLSACKFPFQCAHGRPSMVPLVDLDLSSESCEVMGFALGKGRPRTDELAEETSFGEMWKRWRLSNGI